MDTPHTTYNIQHIQHATQRTGTQGPWDPGTIKDVAKTSLICAAAFNLREGEGMQKDTSGSRNLIYIFFLSSLSFVSNLPLSLGEWELLKMCVVCQSLSFQLVEWKSEAAGGDALHSPSIILSDSELLPGVEAW